MADFIKRLIGGRTNFFKVNAKLSNFNYRNTDVLALKARLKGISLPIYVLTPFP